MNYIYKNKTTGRYYKYNDSINENTDTNILEEAMTFEENQASLYADFIKYDRISLTQELRKYKLQKINASSL